MGEVAQRLDAAARARAAAFLEQNARLEGLELSAASRADSAEWVVGTLTGAEMVTRARSRFGLDAGAGADHQAPNAPSL